MNVQVLDAVDAMGEANQRRLLPAGTRGADTQHD